MEAHAQSGWLFELMVGPGDARVRKCEFVELLVDTGGLSSAGIAQSATRMISTRNLDGSANSRQVLKTRTCARMRQTSFWWTQGQPSMSVGLTTSLTLH